MDGGLENKWLMDSGCSRHMIENKKWFFSLTLTPQSHKKYVTFGNDKKGKVLDTGIIKVNDYFTLNDVTLVDKLRYNLLSISQLVFQADFSFAQFFVKCLISQSSSELWRWHRRHDQLSFDLLCQLSGLCLL
jgi:hypothetical protein